MPGMHPSAKLLTHIHWVGRVDHTVETSGRVEGGTRSGRTRKKPKDLSACDREERGRGKGVCLYAVCIAIARS